MRVFAPGKLVLTGAYAVLEGAPAVVVATSLGAFADSSRIALSPTPEVRAALGDVPAPHADASQLFVGGRKLGLGASGAILVASLAARDARSGLDLGEASVREHLFVRARRAHAEAQGGGSGVDVAASIHGGVLRYVIDAPTSVALPPGTNLVVFACPTSARTRDLRADIDRFAGDEPLAHRSAMGDLVAIANDAASALGDLGGFVDAMRRTARALARLGALVEREIVPAGFDMLEAVAKDEGGAFCVAGAGGGDVAAFVGTAPPSARFLEAARTLGLFRLDLQVDEKGVRVDEANAVKPQALAT